MSKILKAKFFKSLSVLVFVLGFIFFSSNMYASEHKIKKFYQDIQINIDGSITIRDVVLLDGDYNGFEKEIDFYANSYEFTGSYSNFAGGTKIYNGSEIVDVEVYDIAQENLKTIDDVFRVENLYKRVNSANIGDYGIYTLKKSSIGIELKIFSPYKRKKAFGVKYTIKDAVVVHNDIAELFWDLIPTGGRLYIEEFESRINLPDQDENFIVFEHALEPGVLNKLNSRTVMYSSKNIEPRNAKTIRLLFDKELIKYSNKKSGVDAKEQILKVEKASAKEIKNLMLINEIESRLKLIEKTKSKSMYDYVLDLILSLEEESQKIYLPRLEQYRDVINEEWKQNIEKQIQILNSLEHNEITADMIGILKKDISEGFYEEEKQEYYKIVSNYEKILNQRYYDVRKISLYVILSMYLILTLLVIISYINKRNIKKKEIEINKKANDDLEEYSKKDKYFKELLSNDKPYVVEYLMRKKITNRSFTATIFDLVEKNVMKLEKIEKEDEDYNKSFDDEENVKLIYINKDYKPSKAEKIILNILFEIIGENEVCYLYNFGKYTYDERKAKKLLKKINRFYRYAKKEAEEKIYFYENKKGILLVLLILIVWIASAIMSIGLFLGLRYSFVFVLLYLIAISVINFSYIKIIRIDKVRTYAGRVEYLKWSDYKKFLKNFKLNEKDIDLENIEFNKHAIMAIIFDYSKKLQESMNLEKEIYKNMKKEDYIKSVNRFLLAYSIYTLINATSRLISRSVKNANSRSVSSSSSSSSSSSGSSIASRGGGGGGFGSF